MRAGIGHESGCGLPARFFGRQGDEKFMGSRHLTSLGLGLFMAGIVLSVAYLPQFAVVIFVSLALDLLLSGLVDRMEARVPRLLAAFSVLFCFVLLMVVVFVILYATVVPMGQDFVNKLPQMVASFMALPWVKELPLFGEEINNAWTQLTKFSVGFMSSSLSMLVSAFSRVIDIVLILLSTYYLLAEGAEIKAWLVSLFAADQQGRIAALLENILRSLRVFIISQIKICLLMGVVVYSYFAFRDLPYGPVFAVFSGVCEFFPLVGPVIASCFASLIMVTVSPVIGFHTIIFFLFVTQLNHNLIYPSLVGHSLRLHPLAIILGLTLAGELIGPLGMFLAVPTMVTLRLVVEDIHRAFVEKETNE